MAIVQNPLIGRASGSVGNIVFQTQYGQNTIRSKPIFVTPNNTPARMLWRSKMSTICKIIGIASSAIISYAPKAVAECCTTSYMIGSFLKYATRENIEDPFTINEQYFLGGGFPFFLKPGFKKLIFVDEYYKINYGKSGSELYNFDNDSKFYTIFLDEYFNYIYATDETYKHPEYDVLLLNPNYKEFSNCKYVIITIQNTPNSLGQYPADYYLPTTKENLQNFYLFASL